MSILVVIFILGMSATLICQMLIRIGLRLYIKGQYRKQLRELNKEISRQRKQTVNKGIQQLEDYLNEE